MTPPIWSKWGSVCILEGTSSRDQDWRPIFALKTLLPTRESFSYSTRGVRSIQHSICGLWSEPSRVGLAWGKGCVCKRKKCLGGDRGDGAMGRRIV